VYVGCPGASVYVGCPGARVLVGCPGLVVGVALGGTAVPEIQQISPPGGWSGGYPSRQTLSVPLHPQGPQLKSHRGGCVDGAIDPLGGVGVFVNPPVLPVVGVGVRVLEGVDVGVGVRVGVRVGDAVGVFVGV
jgi:hypothetical protein